MNETPLLQIRDLSVTFDSFSGSNQVLKDVGLDLQAGRVTALVGETGSGKSVLVQAIMRMLPADSARASGTIALDGNMLQDLDEAELRNLRGSKIGLVVTNPRAQLNPVQTIGSQLVDAIAAHTSNGRKEDHAKRALELLNAVGIPDPERRSQSYPHELSGGMCQRVLIAMALANRPRLILADEPTSGLDVTIQLQVMDLLKKLVAELGSAVLLVTRDLGLAAHYADEVVVIREGEIVERSTTREFFAGPRHAYSRMLLETSRATADPVAAILPQGQPQGASAEASILEVDGLVKQFHLDRGKSVVYAVNDVSFSIMRGETLSLVGESGSGKTTTGRLVLGLTKPTEGKIVLLGTDLGNASAKVVREHRPRMQIVFQEPRESLDPRFTIGRSIEEPLLFRGSLSKKARQARVEELLNLVRMPASIARLYPHQISAGQQQRAAIARAIATDPDLIVLDEPTSSLDISVRGEILTLLRNLQAELGLSYLFISHDLAAVEQVSHRIAIMYLGFIVEIGPAEAIFRRQIHPYGRALISSVLAPDPEQRQQRLTLTGEIPSPVKRPRGCPLSGRCPLEIALCSQEIPAMVEVGEGHQAACHRVQDILAARTIEALAAQEGRLPQMEAVL